MNINLEREIIMSFPSMFSSYFPLNTSKWEHFNCNDGWFNIILELCKELRSIHDVTGISITCNQVKNKFGELRFYVTTDASSINPEMDAETVSRIVYGLCHKYEERSRKVCEECGDRGKIFRLKYIECLCNKCLENKLILKKDV